MVAVRTLVANQSRWKENVNALYALWHGEVNPVPDNQKQLL